MGSGAHTLVDALWIHITEATNELRADVRRLTGPKVQKAVPAAAVLREAVAGEDGSFLGGDFFVLGLVEGGKP